MKHAFFETNTILLNDDELARIDDISETINHFKMIDHMLENIFELLSERIIKDLHFLLKRNSKDGNGRVGRVLAFK